MQLSNIIAAALFATGSATASAVLESRGYPQNCTHYSGSGGTLCLDRPSDCSATYNAQPDDNCHSIVQKFGNFTPSILYYWNPDIGRDCYGIRAYVPLCINTPWYRFQRPVEYPGGTIEVAAKQSATNQTVPLAAGTWANCTKYEKAGDGYYEYDMKTANGFTDQQFCNWNKGVNCSASGGPQVQAYYWYAVAC